MRQVTPIIKPISTACNISCSYCYHAQNRLPVGLRMSTDTLSRLIKDLASLNQPRMRFIWHGGEPTLAGIQFYEKVVEFQSDYLEPGKRIVNSIQTNGTTLNRAWAEFFRKNRFRVGISLDGPRVLHDAQRKTISGKGTFNRIMESIDLLRSFDVPIGIVAVVTKSSIGRAKEAFDFFYGRGLYRLNFSPAADFDNSGKLLGYSLTPEEWGEFLIDLFDVWLQKDDSRVKIHILESLLQSLIGGKPTICTYFKDCTRFFSVDYNGDIYFCGRFLGNTNLRLGNINESSLNEIIAGAKLREISGLVSFMRQECIGCEWSNACNGGCPSHRYSPGQKLDAPYYFCESTKIILNHMKARLQPYLTALPKICSTNEGEYTI